MPDKWECRFFEVRADVDKRLLEGTALVYGDVALTPNGEESFMPQPFGDLANRQNILLHFQHERARPLARTGGGGLVLTDSREKLMMAATMPRTRDGDDALELVRAGILQGISIEFAPLRTRAEGTRRVIQTAFLGGLGLVDIPAYAASGVEVREQAAGRRRRQWL